MIKRIFTLAAITAVFAANTKAQFIITQSNMPINGTIATNVTDSAASVFNGNAGTNETWDFTALGASSIDTMTYMMPAGNPGASSFAGATLSAYSTLNMAYSFFIIDASAFSVAGQHANATNTDSKYDKPSRKFVFPMTYQDAFDDTAILRTKNVINPQIKPLIRQYFGKTYDSSRTVTTIISSNTIDATGKMMTPEGTFNNVMRLYRAISTTPHSEFKDSATGQWESNAMLSPYVDVASTTDKYEWISASYAAPVASTALVTIKNNTTFSASYLKNAGKATTGVQKIANNTAEGLKIYPNPASTELNISLASSKASKLTIYDVLGKQRATVNVLPGSVNKFDVSSLDAGMYLYRLAAENGEITSTGKFNISR